MAATQRRTHVDDDVVTAEPTRAQANDNVVSFVSEYEKRHGSSPEPRFYLSGTDEHDRVELSPELFSVLRRAAGDLAAGRSVSILARDQEMTTQQAAELLGISRPTVVKLIDSGELEAHVPGSTRRKLYLKDVLKYRDELHERRTAFIAESSEDYADLRPDEVAEALSAVRRAR